MQKAISVYETDKSEHEMNMKNIIENLQVTFDENYIRNSKD